ncbi:hypothetical protein B0H14DRAFT_2601578 [Mycena olivaceomarginata]|nr:hypothetical protein B0H14DRAFT_2601578 [Mycena olivaceomarginata]
MRFPEIKAIQISSSAFEAPLKNGLWPVHFTFPHPGQIPLVAVQIVAGTNAFLGKLSQVMISLSHPAQVDSLAFVGKFLRRLQSRDNLYLIFHPASLLFLLSLESPSYFFTLSSTVAASIDSATSFLIPAQVSSSSLTLQAVSAHLSPQMPWQKSDAVADMAEDERQRILAQIRRLPPTDACDALLNVRPYLEHPGFVYTHMRVDWDVLHNPPAIADADDLDYLDIKVGETIHINARRASYTKCDGEELIWCFYYPTNHPKLIERLTHLTLAAIGAKRLPNPCKGCQVCHREHFSEQRAGLEFVVLTIEYWIRRIGEVPVKYAMYADN